jgi:hypothetical protein
MTKKQKVVAVLLPLLLLGGYFAYSQIKKKKVVPTPPKKKPAQIIIEDTTGGIIKDAEYVTTKQGTNLRQTPSTSARILKSYDAGVLLYVTSSGRFSEYDWWEVNDGLGNIGWVRADVVDIYDDNLASQFGSYE